MIEQVHELKLNQNKTIDYLTFQPSAISDLYGLHELWIDSNDITDIPSVSVLYINLILYFIFLKLIDL